MSDDRSRADLPHEPPQVPVDERDPAKPKIGADEWVASVEERRLARAGVFAPLLAAYERAPKPALAAGVILLAATFPLLTSSDYLIRVGVNAILFALLALGLNVVVGWAGLLDLGYIAFYGFGAYAYAYLASSQWDIHLPAIAAVPVVVVATALLGLLLGLPSRRLVGDYLAIVTLFFAQIFIVVTTNGNRISFPFTGRVDLTGGPNGIAGVDPFRFAGVEAIEVSSYYWVSLALFAAIMVALYFLDDSRTGRAWRALREDPLAAEAMTMPVNRLKLLAFVFGAGVAGLSGSVFAAVQIGVFPQNFELPLLITVYAMVILGGAGSLGGVVIGAVAITVFLEVLRSPDDARLVFYGLVAIGIFGLVKPLARAAAVAAATVVFGYAVHAIVGAVWADGTARPALRGEGLGELVDGWVLLPLHPGTFGDVTFVLLVLAILGLSLLKGAWRTAALVPVIYLAAIVWENQLVFQPSVTRFLFLGAMLVATMNMRPEGLFGTSRVEIV